MRSPGIPRYPQVSPTSRRVYREPLTIEQARAELKRCSGTRYDPCVVEAFLRVLDTPESITMDIRTQQEVLSVEVARLEQEPTETANV